MDTELRQDQRRRRESLLAESAPCTCGELVGVTAADCAAVMCCFPLTVVNLLVVLAYKIPRAICRKTGAGSRRRRRALRKSGSVGSEPVGPEIEAGSSSSWSEEEVRRVEKEMWDSFYGTGFWRSPSQKDLA